MVVSVETHTKLLFVLGTPKQKALFIPKTKRKMTHTNRVPKWAIIKIQHLKRERDAAKQELLKARLTLKQFEELFESEQSVKKMLHDALLAQSLHNTEITDKVIMLSERLADCKLELHRLQTNDTAKN